VSLSYALRYRALLDWLKTNGADTAGLPTTYADLRDEARARRLIRFIDTHRTLPEPFATTNSNEYSEE
jgi:hypothetical protein